MSCRISIPREQFRQPGEIKRHLSRLVDRHDAGVPCAARGPAVEHADLLLGGVLNGESARQLDGPPGDWEAGGHGLFFAGRRVVPAFGSLALNPGSIRRRMASDRLGGAACWRRQPANASVIFLVMAN